MIEGNLNEEAETPPNNKVKCRERISMGAAASIDASAVPGIKEEYEKKMAEGECAVDCFFASETCVLEL